MTDAKGRLPGSVLRLNRLRSRAATLLGRRHPRTMGTRRECPSEEALVAEFTAKRPDKEQGQDQLFHNPFPS